MDWSPITEHRGSLLLLLGFVCLLNPGIVGAFDIGDPDYYRYEPLEVTFHENETIDVPIEVGTVDSDVACFEQFPRRACMLEQAIHANGGLQYDGLPERVLESDYDYVWIYGEGFFEPIAEETDETVTYDIRPVDQSTALERITTPLENAPDPIQTAVTTGRYETSDELENSAQLVRDDGRYYVLHLAEAHVRPGERLTIVVILQWVLGVVGAGLILRGQRLRVTDDS